MPLQATSGAASQDGFGGNGVPVIPNYIEEVFSTWLYTGTGSAQTITNNIDLSTNGGMVWFKCRSTARNHSVIDTVRGVGQVIYPDFDLAQNTSTQTLTAFNTTGFSIGTNASVSASGDTFASWTFRKQPKFFDVVTYTGTGSNTTVAHALGSVPACIMVKRTDTTGDWQVYHRSLANTEYLVLNSTAAKATGATRWNSTTPTSAVFSVGTDASVNASGGTYVAYVFAHNAGGFGLTGTDNVISCGSFTTDGSGDATINLGYEAQWVLMKQSGGSGGNWFLFDNMRGMPVQLDGGAFLRPNLSNAETTTGVCQANSTGFFFDGSYVPGSNASATFIYIAIRRGPMKVPTSGTSVFSPQSTTLNTSSNTIVSSSTVGPIDFVINQQTSASGGGGIAQSRLTGGNYLFTRSTDAEASSSYTNWDRMTGTKPIPASDGEPVAVWQFKRAPSFFDEVCYIGTGSNTTFSHNLTVAPELMIVKSRSNPYVSWFVYASALGATKYLILDGTNSASTFSAAWNNTAPTSSVFTVGGAGATNGTGETFVAYLFATCAGVSKVGSYTGNGSSQTINCGFTSGARFVLIKRTDSTGDWMVSDSARGIVSGNDPYLELNNTNAEVTGEDWLDTDSTGFVVNEVSGSNANTNGASYIFLAIA